MYYLKTRNIGLWEIKEVTINFKDPDNSSVKDLAHLYKHPTYKITRRGYGGASRTKEFSTEIISFLQKR